MDHPFTQESPMCNFTMQRNVFSDQIPSLQRIAGSSFAGLPPEAREEAIANSVAIAWKFKRAFDAFFAD